MTQSIPEEIAADIIGVCQRANESGLLAAFRDGYPGLHKLIADAIRKEREEAENRGWNAAKAACEKKAMECKRFVLLDGQEMSQHILGCIRALEKL